MHAARERGGRRGAAPLGSHSLARLHRRAEFQSALELLEPLLRDERQYGLFVETANALQSLGEWKEARRAKRRAGHASDHRRPRGGGGHLAQLATIDLNEGNYAAAREKFGKSLAIKQAIGDRAGEAATWHQLATIDVNEGNYAAAREKFAQALAMQPSIGDRAGEAATWHNLATIDLNEGNYAAAREKFGKSLAMQQAIGDRAGEAATWHQLATIDVNEGTTRRRGRSSARRWRCSQPSATARARPPPGTTWPR